MIKILKLCKCETIEKNINLGAESREADECDSLTGLSPKANN
jgi:hypothetical protein